MKPATAEAPAAESPTDPGKQSASNGTKSHVTFEEHNRIREEGKNEWFRHIAARDKAEYEYRVEKRRP